MKETKRERYYLWLYLVAIAVVFTIYHYFYDMTIGDVPAYFSRILTKESGYLTEKDTLFTALFRFTRDRSMHWSSRYRIEAVLVLIASLPVWVWHILDILVLLPGAYSMAELTGIRNPGMKYMGILTLVMMYPVKDMCSAGWIATTMNYSWCLSLGLYALLIIRRIHKEEKVKPVSLLAAIPAFMYAVNHEQMCLIFVILLAGIVGKEIYDWKKHEKKIHKAIPIFLGGSLLQLVYILVCPGNAERKLAETAGFFPEFAEYSLVDKAYLGFARMMNAFFEDYNFMLLLLFVFMAWCMLQSDEKTWKKLISCIPALYLVLRIGVHKVFHTTFYGIFLACNETRLSELTAFDYVSLLIMLGMAVLFFWTCCMLFSTENNVILYLLVLLAAIASAFVSGFSPTVFVSGYRVYLFLYAGFVYVLLKWVKIHEEKISGYWKLPVWGAVIALNLILILGNISVLRG